MYMILKTNIIIIVPNCRTTVTRTTFTNKQITFCGRTGFNFVLCKIHNFYIVKDEIPPIKIGCSYKFLWCSTTFVTTTLLFSTCMIENVTDAFPFPSIRNLKRNLIINTFHFPRSEELLIIGTQ